MPIYAYRCTHCGHELDALQKLSEPALTECPACHHSALVKKVTAAGFQLKGSGWYQTDFRNGSKPAAADAKPDAKTDAKAEPASETKLDAKSGTSDAATTKSETKSDSSTPATPAASSGSGR